MNAGKQVEDKTTFGKNLERELEQSGLTLGGHYPLLKVLFYVIETDFDRGKATLWYGPQQDKLGECDIVASEVVAMLKKWQDAIERPVDDQTFLQTLYDVGTTFAERTGDPVAIDDILSEYVSRKIYRTKKDARVLFVHSLFRLKEREIDNLQLSLVVATRAYTSRRKDFIWVPTDERGGGMYISHVKFRKIDRSVSDFREEIEKKIEEGV